MAVFILLHIPEPGSVLSPRHSSKKKTKKNLTDSTKHLHQRAALSYSHNLVDKLLLLFFFFFCLQPAGASCQGDAEPTLPPEGDRGVSAPRAFPHRETADPRDLDPRSQGHTGPQTWRQTTGGAAPVPSRTLEPVSPSGDPTPGLRSDSAPLWLLAIEQIKHAAVSRTAPSSGYKDYSPANSPNVSGVSPLQTVSSTTTTTSCWSSWKVWLFLNTAAASRTGTQLGRSTWTTSGSSRVCSRSSRSLSLSLCHWTQRVLVLMLFILEPL